MLVHRLIAYDLQTEEMVVELPIKESLLPTLRVMAGIPPTDPQAIGSYPLTPSVIRDIAEDVDIDPDSAALFDWFLEAFEVESEYA